MTDEMLELRAWYERLGWEFVIEEPDGSVILGRAPSTTAPEGGTPP